jgi:hypothetical protein
MAGGEIEACARLAGEDQLGTLGDDALQMHLAGLLEENRFLSLDVIGIPDRSLAGRRAINGANACLRSIGGNPD